MDQILGQAVGKVTQLTDAREGPKGKHTPWSYFEPCYKQGPVLNYRASEHL